MPASAEQLVGAGKLHPESINRLPSRFSDPALLVETHLPPPPPDMSGQLRPSFGNRRHARVGEFTPLSGVTLRLGKADNGGCELSGQVELTIERVKRSYASTASQMQCPFHQKNARVEVAGETLDDLNVEVFACCEEFVKRVQDALRDTL